MMALNLLTVPFSQPSYYLVAKCPALFFCQCSPFPHITSAVCTWFFTPLSYQFPGDPSITSLSHSITLTLLYCSDAKNDKGLSVTVTVVTVMDNAMTLDRLEQLLALPLWLSSLSLNVNRNPPEAEPFFVDCQWPPQPTPRHFLPPLPAAYVQTRGMAGADPCPLLSFATQVGSNVEVL
jgi:hypothetical protein